MKHLLILLLLLAAVGPLTAASRGDADMAMLIDRWRTERDQAVLSLVRLHLRGASQSAQRESLARVIDLEANLLDKPGEVLFVSALSGRDPESAIQDIFREYLKRRGLVVKTERFFAGQTFYFLPGSSTARVARKD
ncbi:MAG: hypothetical protein ACFE0O_04405 [Opitutales bacterium]